MMAQAMLRRRRLVSKKMEEDNNNDDDYKRYLNVNLLTTMYPLNNSWTKKIIVGLHYNDEARSFNPLIQFLNTQYTHGLHISRGTWSDLQNHFGEIEEYFEDCRRNNNTANTLRLEDIDVFFTTTFGTKSVVFDKSRAITEVGSSKRRKSCPPTVVMQKRTFQGLKRTVTCVDERFFRLDRITSNVNKCKNFIKNELSSILDSAIFKKKDADVTVNNTLKEHAIQIQEKLKKEFDVTADAAFLEHYFDIVYLELITIYYDVFSYELADELTVRKTRSNDKMSSPVM